ncbi:IclR family transcriptional regulator [Niallia sp. Krafla_26]|uniref:IclR family transcriptional regulator n=1 Tax=Niallia sp. Krafla_26 TaxID=3064703 RepID=UPI003D16C5CE
MKEQRYSSLENALRVLELFSIEEPDLSVREVAERLSVADSTSHRLLKTLLNEGFVTKDDRSNRYRLGISIRALESVIKKDLSLYHTSQHVLSTYVTRVCETISICVLHRNQTFYLHTVEPDPEQMFYTGLTYVGKRQHVLFTSAGKVLLSDKTKAEVKTVLSEVENELSLEHMMAELKQINEKGYNISYNNFSSGITSISAPVKNKDHQVIAAVEILGPGQRITTEILGKYVKLIKEIAHEIETRVDIKNVAIK